MKRILILFILFIALPIKAQQNITLEECYQLLAKNYPLVKQHGILIEQNRLDTEIIGNSKLPQINVNAQATYQSDVIQIPIPNAGIEPLNKDQYRATISVNQLIYNGNASKASLQMKSAQLNTKQQQINVSLYQLKQEINQLYFSILLNQEATLLIKSKQRLLQTKIKEVKSGIAQGMILPSSDKILEAEYLKTNQQFIELESTKNTLIETLSSLIGKPLGATTLFQIPLIQIDLQKRIKRPELDLFQFKKDEISSSEALLSKENAPKIFGFATGGYGNPGLNMLDNSFQTFYTVGLSLKWNVFDWNTNKKQRESLAINKELIENETEVFTLNTRIALNKQQKEIEKIESFIQSDKEIIKLRLEVLNSSNSQLNNGVITSSAYILELTNLYEDENTLIKHNMLLELAKANYNIIKGN